MPSHEPAYNCKRCGETIKTVFTLDAYAYPYNPEWPLERIDAGRFCSGDCLCAYLQPDRVAVSPPEEGK